MAKFFKQFKDQMREREAAQAILDQPIADRPIVVYSEDDYSWNQLGPYVTAVTAEQGLPITYVTSDSNDPLLAQQPEGVTVVNITASISAFLPKIDSPVFVTTMPDLDTYHIKRPAKSLVAYVFHSLNSIHMAYRTGAFDAYDAFLCTGPHHKAELEAHYSMINKPLPELFEVGYPKLDGIVHRFNRYSKQHPDETTVLIAPSWGDHNLLAAMGPDLVEALTARGFRVVVRPHPAFFESIYPEGRAIVGDIERTFDGNDQVVVESSITTEDSFLEADLMICDWSGAAYEYALGTRRPVLSIDLPPKVNNADWESLGIVPFENRMRFEIGEVIESADVGVAADMAEQLIARSDQFEVQLNELRESSVYNVGSSASVGGQVLAELAHRGLTQK
ncbi:MAG: CDP-glycerol glycerophosphotransferase family protein [Acidimicrobiia bacterium]